MPTMLTEAKIITQLFPLTTTTIRNLDHLSSDTDLNLGTYNGPDVMSI